MKCVVQFAVADAKCEGVDAFRITDSNFLIFCFLRNDEVQVV